jgi:hypothetical protein
MDRVTHYPDGRPIPPTFYTPDGRPLLHVGFAASPDIPFVEGFRETSSTQWLNVGVYARGAGVPHCAPVSRGDDGSAQPIPMIPSPYSAGCLAALYARNMRDVSPEDLFQIWVYDPEWVANGWYIRACGLYTPHEEAEKAFDAGFYKSATREPNLQRLLRLALQCPFSAALVAALDAELTDTVDDCTLDERFDAWRNDPAAAVALWAEVLPGLIEQKGAV